MQQSLVLLKPDAIQRGLAGKIISRLEEKGLKTEVNKIVDSLENVYLITLLIRM